MDGNVGGWMGRPLRVSPKVEVINAWRDVGRELVRLCQQQHAAARSTHGSAHGSTKGRAKSHLLHDEPVTTAALLRNPELTARRSTELPAALLS